MMTSSKGLIYIAALALLAFVCNAAMGSDASDGDATALATSVNANGGDTASIPDFDGDGTIGFGDFVIFAGVFGARQGDEKYDATHDLNGDGEIGFSDFLIFSENYGKSVPSYTLSGIVKDGRRHGLNLPGAVVELQDGNNRPMVADNEGYYAFLNVRGSISVTASHDLFLPESIDLVMERDRTVDLIVQHNGKSPYQGTVWITPEILVSTDSTTFQEIQYAGRELRLFWNGAEWVEENIYKFHAHFATRLKQTVFSVHPEYRNQTAARKVVEQYAHIVGRLPAVFLYNIHEIQIGRNIGGASANRDGQVHLDAAEEWVVNDGWLEEVLIHEGAHASLDKDHAEDDSWLEAQKLDGVFISEYATEHPGREDVAESVLVWFAVRYFPERLTVQDYQRFLHTMPNRLQYFDQRKFDMSPYVLPQIGR